MPMMYTATELLSKKTWESFLDVHSPHALFQRWDWGEAQKAAGAHVWRFGYRYKGKLIAIAQVFLVSARRGTFLHVRHGPVLALWKKPYMRFICTHLEQWAKENRATFIRMSPLIPTSSQSFLSGFGFRSAPVHAMDAELCWVLDLRQGEDDLLKQMRKTTRYEIHKAEKLGVSVRTSVDPKDIGIFLDLYRRTSKRHGFVEHHGITEEFHVFAKEGNALLFFGELEKKPIAAALILFVGGQAIYHHGASLSGPVPASYLVQWHAIREAKRRGMTVYNFWGIAPEYAVSHPWQGLTLFKKGFGGYEQSYLHAQDLPISVWYIVPYSVEFLRKIRKRY